MNQKGRALRNAALLGLCLTAGAQAGPMSLDGQFSVSESGAATYTIPIQVPPGTGGVEPKLALTYNSQTGNGLLGVGWSLSGLSAITRCPRTLAQDNVRGSVNFDNNDRFCLDGQRLLAVNGTYGADGTEYRTERESYSKIVSYGTAGNGPAWFKVWTKAGQVIEYGNTADSRIEAIKAPNSTATWPTTTARLWAINKVADTKGNYLTYSYTEDQANGDYYPTRIDYTGNSNTNLTPNNSVQFVYEARGDIVPTYHAGSFSKNILRLSKLQTFNVPSLIKEQRISYESSSGTNRSRISALTECVNTSSCLTSIVLTWLNSNSGFTSTQSSVFDWTGPYNFSGYSYQFPDINGDGKSDLAILRAESGKAEVLYRLANGNGFDAQQQVIDWSGSDFSGHRFQFADVNGDGLPDLIVTRAESGRAEVSFRVGTGSGFGTSQQVFEWSGPYNFSGYSYQFPDLNGDGKADLAILRAENGKAEMLYRLSNGAGFGPQQQVIDWSGSDFSGHRFQFADVNGDGLPDLIVTRAESGRAEVSFRVGTGSGFGTSQQVFEWSGPYNFSGYSYQFPDLNGDGKADLAILRAENGKAEMLYRLSNGAGFGPQQQVIDWSGSDFSGHRFQFADVNGDGLPDLIVTRAESGRAEVSFRVGTGSGFGTSQQVFEWSGSYNFSGHSYQFPDINGDGRIDLVITRAESGKAEVIYRLGFSPAPDVLSAVASSLTAATSFAYNPITNSSTYTKDTGPNASVYPKLDIQSPMYVVSSVSSSNGIGGTVTTNYKYGGLKAEIGTGRGLLGFRWMESTQAETGIITRTEYRQDWPYVGLPSIVKKSLPGAGNNGLLSQVSNSYSCLNPQSGSACTISTGNRYFPYLSQSVESSWDLNGTALPIVTTTHQFDAWGNATQVTVGTNDGYSKTTTNQYSNDATNWYLGRLTRSQVQSVTP